MPPLVGVGALCKLLSIGLSINHFLNAGSEKNCIKILKLKKNIKFKMYCNDILSISFVVQLF